MDFNGFTDVLAKLREQTSMVSHPETRNDGKGLPLVGLKRRRINRVSNLIESLKLPSSGFKSLFFFPNN